MKIYTGHIYEDVWQHCHKLELNLSCHKDNPQIQISSIFLILEDKLELNRIRPILEMMHCISVPHTELFSLNFNFEYYSCVSFFFYNKNFLFSSYTFHISGTVFTSLTSLFHFQFFQRFRFCTLFVFLVPSH